jgi:hypothetical protein
MQNIRILVCKTCYDTPQEQLRAIVVPADPLPIIQARPENYVADSVDDLTANYPTVYDPVTGIPVPSTTGLLTQSLLNITTQPIGSPNGLTPNAISPLNGKVHYGMPVPFLSIVSNGSTFITVTCSSPHNLSTNDQISVNGLENSLAEGFYSVTVTTATAFTYEVLNPVLSASLATSETIMVTVTVGLPYDYPQIPLTGNDISVSVENVVFFITETGAYWITESGDFFITG